MKKYISFYFCLLLLLVLSAPASAQILKKLGEKLEKRMEGNAEASIPDETEEGEPVQSLDANYQIEVTGSGPDLYLEYRMQMQTESKQASQMQMHMKMYASPQSGKGRAETVITMPIIGEMKMITLSEFQNPERVIIINDRKKQYSEIDFSEIEHTEPGDQYKVNKLGQVDLHGLKCVHAEAINNQGDRFEIWTTQEIPGYQDMMALYSKAQNAGSDDLWKALQEAGCAGFMVKLQVSVEGGTSVMELTEIEKSTHPQEIYSIPEGYKKSEGGWVDRYIKQRQ